MENLSSDYILPLSSTQSANAWKKFHMQHPALDYSSRIKKFEEEFSCSIIRKSVQKCSRLPEINCDYIYFSSLEDKISFLLTHNK